MSGDPEELCVCPYDPIHMVARKRMQYHLMKCRKNFNHHDYKTCPFNARHVVPKPEFEYHVRECPDRARVDAEVLQRKRQKDPYQLKGYTDIPVSDWTAPEASECWDDDNVVYVPPSQDGLHSSSEQANRVERPPLSREEKPKATVKEPPQPRMPQMGAHMESQVYSYSLASMKERQPPPSEPVRIHPIGLGRGRGIGRGLPPPGFKPVQKMVFATEQPVGVLGAGGGVSGVPVMGAGGGGVNGVPVLGAGRGLSPVLGVGRGLSEKYVQQPTVVHPSPPRQPQGSPASVSGQVMPSGAIAQPVVQGMSGEELTKRERKLRKMLRQIENLEEKLRQGDQLDPEALAKISRKADVIDQIGEIEKLNPPVTGQ